MHTILEGIYRQPSVSRSDAVIRQPGQLYTLLWLVLQITITRHVMKQFISKYIYEYFL